ncbi:MAG: hypothetical protein HC902_06245 [Calothrix sp. SM1_5_4]|nr:hypothetical protein [Calothrix sp. SM1_5_4]
MVVLPQGDLLIISKELSLRTFSSRDAGVYILPAGNLPTGKIAGSDVLALRKLGQLPMTKWLPKDSGQGHAITDAAVNRKRNTLLLLTYRNAIEIDLSFLAALDKSANWTAGKEYAVVPLKPCRSKKASPIRTPATASTGRRNFFRRRLRFFSMACLRFAP